jgi:outer membrane immunogenic protein
MPRHSLRFFFILLLSLSIRMFGQRPQNTLDPSVMYTKLHANAPFGDCGCFWMQGGSG